MSDREAWISRRIREAHLDKNPRVDWEGFEAVLREILKTHPLEQDESGLAATLCLVQIDNALAAFTGRRGELHL
jgi:hypothetical protein